LFGVTSLALDGFADWTTYRAIWVTCWLGDVTGDLIFTQLVLLWGIRWKLFQQIIWNVLKNAIKFTPEGGEIMISSDNPSETVFTVAVRDSGIGMEPEVMQRIFDPFEQGNRSFEHRFGGLGLGPAISKSLAQTHGGTLTAQSDGSNRDSTFTLSMQALPQGEAASVASKAVTDSA
jgi:signal transduction histidine kinase